MRLWFVQVIILSSSVFTFSEFLQDANSITETEALFLDKFYNTDRTHLEYVLQQQGYLGEIHECITEDGFKVMLHRIKPRKVKRRREAVMLVHGAFMNAAVWLSLSPTHSLAYELSDIGYDVWLFSSRGKQLLNGHISLMPDNIEYWDWGQDEIGYFDVPASIDYILKKTGLKQVTLISHSMGANCIFIALSERPEYNPKVRLVIALAPAFGITLYGKGVIWKAVETFSKLILQLNLQHASTNAVVLTDSNDFGRVLYKNCSNSETRKACPTPIAENIGFSLYNPERNSAYMYRFICTNIARVSRKIIIEVGERNANVTGNYTKFDYGPIKNFEIYKTDGPGVYNFSNINVPLHLFYGTNDHIVTKKEVTTLFQTLLEYGSDTRFHEVTNSDFGHMDFVLNQDAKHLVHKNILQIINR